MDKGSRMELLVRRMRVMIGCLILLGASSAWGHTQAGAANNDPDNNQPIHIDADHWRLDSLHQESIFSGKVIFTKGSLVITGRRLFAKQDAKGQQFAHVEAAKGGVATFRKKQFPNNDLVMGRASSLDYDSALSTITLKGNAQLRRYQHHQLTNQVTGAIIIYNTKNETMTVDGKAPHITGEKDDRVHAVIFPATDEKNASDGEPAVASSRLDLQEEMTLTSRTSTKKP